MHHEVITEKSVLARPMERGGGLEPPICCFARNCVTNFATRAYGYRGNGIEPSLKRTGPAWGQVEMRIIHYSTVVHSLAARGPTNMATSAYSSIHNRLDRTIIILDQLKTTFHFQRRLCVRAIRRFFGGKAKARQNLHVMNVARLPFEF